MTSSFNPGKSAFLARTGSTFGKLAALYSLYAGWMFFGDLEGVPLLDRLVLVGGGASFALALLVAPAVFVAGSDFDLFAEQGPKGRRRDWKWLGMLAAGACLLTETGVPLSEYLLDLLSPNRTRGVPEPGVRYYDRILVPIAVGAFIVISGVAGAAVAYMTNGSGSLRRNLVRSLTCLSLAASFWVSLLICSDLVRSNGSVPVVLIVVGPPLIPLLATCWLVRSQGYRVLEVVGLDRLNRRMDHWLDREAVDRLAGAVSRPDTPTALVIEGVARNQTEVEAAQFMLAVKRAAAPAVRVSEVEARETVARVLAATSTRAAPSRATSFRWLTSDRVGDFGVSWACLSAGLVLFGLIGAVPPNALAALALALLGTAVQNQWFRPARALAPTRA